MADAPAAPSPTTLTTPPGPRLARTAAAFLRRDLGVAASYRLGFVMRVGSLLVMLASLTFLARFVGPAEGTSWEYGAAGYVGFWVVGLLIADLFAVTVSALSGPIREAQVQGTLEAMLATPAPAAHVVLSAGLAVVLMALVRLLLALGFAAAVLGIDFSSAHAGSVALVAILALAAFLSLALLGGALTMSLRRTDPVTVLVGALTMVAGGVFYPVAMLPAALQPLAWALPITPTLEGLRAALFAGAPPSALGRELVALALFTAVVAPLGAWLFALALGRARDDGSLGTY